MATITLSDVVIERLFNLKSCRKDTYSSVITRLLNEHVQRSADLVESPSEQSDSNSIKSPISVESSDLSGSVTSTASSSTSESLTETKSLTESDVLTDSSSNSIKSNPLGE